jgi:L,D-transpeptidase-like protein
MPRVLTAYLSDVTVRKSDKERLHHGTEFHCDVAFAILILPERRIVIHEWSYCDSADGPSEGCIHVCRRNAEAVFNWVEEPTRITIEYPR